MTEKQFKITDEFDDCFYIREKDNEALTTAKDFENKLNEQYETITRLEKENKDLKIVFESRYKSKKILEDFEWLKSDLI